MSLPSANCSTVQCPVQKLAIILSDPWTILIIRDLISSPKRFSDLEKSLTGISTRTLTLKLNKLITEAIIEHKDHLYTTTKKGKKLGTIVKHMAKVGLDF